MKNKDGSPQVVDAEMEKVAGGMPDPMTLGWTVLGDEKKNVQCWQCREWFIYTRGVVHATSGYFCSNDCYQKYLNKGTR